MSYEPGTERIPQRNNREGAMHDVSGSPEQHISASSIKSTNVSMHGGKIITPDAGFMRVNRKGSAFPAKGSAER